jgi:endonuclease/exonuclease/phosphatase family metal-dependent hydrolase
MFASKTALLVWVLCMVWPLAVSTSNLPFKAPVRQSTAIQKWSESMQGGSLDITCITYNTWGLPVRLAGHEQADRFQRMPDSLLALEADILCLQETFHPELRSRLIRALRSEYYMGSDYSCNSSWNGLIVKDCHGGLMTLSKYPVVSEQFFQYPFEKECSIIEKIGAKGFLFTTIDINGHKCNVINTHLYAGEDRQAENFRLLQIQYMMNILAGMPEFALYPTLFMGDINTTHPEISAVSDRFAPSLLYPVVTSGLLGFTDTAPCLDNQLFTYDGKNNHYVNDPQNRQKLDYCFYRNTGNVAILKHQFSKVIFNDRSILSDHFGWKSVFSLECKNTDGTARLWVNN